MSGDANKRVRPGDKQIIAARTWNGLVGMLQREGGRSLEAARGVQREFSSGLALVKNGCGFDLATGDAATVDEAVSAIPTPTDGLDAFRAIPALTVTTPAAGRIVIAAEPIAAGKIGRAWVVGLAVAKVTIGLAGHRYADAATSPSPLVSGYSGQAEILWRAASTGSAVWCVLRLGAAPPAILYSKAPVTGSAGDPAWHDDGTATGNGCYVDVNPCDAAGATVDTSVTHRVRLPRNGRREDPNVRQGSVICYCLDPTGAFVAPSGLLDGKVGESVKIFKGDPANVPPGWALSDAGKFFVGYDANDTDYSTVGNTGGFKLHGGEEGGAANNHEDHDPIAVSGTGVTGPGGDGKGWQDGSWLHTETDNRPPYIVRAWIERVD